MSYGHDNGFVVKDSGKREDYPSGMRRDTQKGKPNYRLIDIPFLTRIADHLVKGAEKYGRDNWRLANSHEELDRFLDSGFRHLMQYLKGDTDEDHMAAVCFNLMAAEHCKLKIQEQQIVSKKNLMDDVRKPFGYGAQRPKENFVQPEDRIDIREDKSKIESKKHQSPDVNILWLMDTIRDAIPGHPNISWVVDEEEIRLYIVWIDYRLSKVIDRMELEMLYEPAALTRTLCREIIDEYQEKIKNKKLA